MLDPTRELATQIQDEAGKFRAVSSQLHSGTAPRLPPRDPVGHVDPGGDTGPAGRLEPAQPVAG